MKKKILAVFLARGGSKRIKNKNIIDFFGKPIIFYGLREAKKSKIFKKIHISTESFKIKKIVKKLGYKIDFDRPNYLSGDSIGTLEVLRYILKKYEALGEKFEIIFNIFPSSPLLKCKDLNEALKIFLNNKMEKPLHVITKYPAPLEWAYYKKKNFIYPVNYKNILTDSKKFKKKFYECGPFAIYSREQIMDKGNNFIKKGFSFYQMPPFRAIDIDEKEDLDFAKHLFKSL